MIHFPKSVPPPPCLEKEKKKAGGDYKCGNVLRRLKEDFENKCYICEYKEPPSINVEHFKPHKGNKDLKFDWANLFWSCAHCNNIKGGGFDNILNCTLPEQGVEDRIKYGIEEQALRFKVNISALHDSVTVQNTVALLLAVYNGTTPLKVIESENIRKILKKELWNFRFSLDCFTDCEDETERAEHLENIRMHLKRSSAFTAFKRWIVKSNSFYREQFERYID